MTSTRSARGDIGAKATAEYTIDYHQEFDQMENQDK